jgi:hypothetical protein
MISPKIVNIEEKQGKNPQAFIFCVLIEVECQIFLPINPSVRSV